MNASELFYSRQNLLEKSLSPQINYNSIEHSQKLKSPNIENGDFSKYILTLKMYRGILIGSLAAFFFSLFGFLNKKASFDTASEQSSLRYFMQLALMILIAKRKHESILGPREQRKLLLVRGVFGAINFISIGFSLKYIEPADTQALFNARLVIIPILASIFLHEKLKLVHIVSFILTIIGVVFICEQSYFMSLTVIQPKNCSSNHSDENVKDFKSYIGISLGIVSAFAASGVAILLKKLTNLKVHYSITVIYSSYIGLPTALLISLVMYLTGTRDADDNAANNAEKLAWQIFYALSSATCGCLNQVLVAIANKYENANVLAIVSTTCLFWSFLFEFLFLDNDTEPCDSSWINVFNILGALLILSAAILNILFKIVQERQKKQTI
jgi:drug/metabolite transporter (DMT)-like permease